MNKGSLHDGTNPVQWIPEGGKTPFWKYSLGKDAIQLGGGGAWKGYSVAAWRCPVCRVVMIPEQ